MDEGIPAVQSSCPNTQDVYCLASPPGAAPPRTAEPAVSEGDCQRAGVRRHATQPADPESE